jgi:DNA-binding FadR family transcriptional regulator
MTVREALRLLESEGLLTIRPGRAGGPMVRRLDGSTFSRHLDLYIRSQEVSLETLFEVRETLAPACAALAARRRTEAELEALRTGNDRLEGLIDNFARFLDQYLAWHVLVAQISRNDVMRAVMESSTRGIWALGETARFQDAELRPLAVRAHQRVIEAVAAGDEEAARRRMLRHVSEFSAVVAQVPGLKEKLAPLAEPAPRRRPPPEKPQKKPRKKADGR